MKALIVILVLSLAFVALGHNHRRGEHNQRDRCSYKATDGSYYNIQKLRAHDRPAYRYIDHNRSWIFNICGRLSETSSLIATGCDAKSSVCIHEIVNDHVVAIDAGRPCKATYKDSALGPRNGLSVTYRSDKYVTTLQLNCDPTTTFLVSNVQDTGPNASTIFINSAYACPFDSTANRDDDDGDSKSSSSGVIVDDNGDSDEVEEGDDGSLPLLVLLGVPGLLIGLCICACAERRHLKRLREKRLRNPQQQDEQTEPLITQPIPSYPSSPAAPLPTPVNDASTATYLQAFEPQQDFSKYYPYVPQQPQQPYGYYPMVVPTYNPLQSAAPQVHPPTPSGFQFVQVMDVNQIPDDEQMARNMQDRINRGLE